MIIFLTRAQVVYANYKSAIDVFEGGAGIRTVPGFSTNATAGIFCTYPQPCMDGSLQGVCLLTSTYSHDKDRPILL
jgi:hypothetical protein